MSSSCARTVRHAFSAAAAGCWAVTGGDIAGQEPPTPEPDKWAYHLFNPTPRQWMRPMATDRPDQTESPYTIDAGHFQVEMDFLIATFDRDRADGRNSQTEVWSAAPLNLKLGLLNNVDIQFVLDTYIRSRLEDRAGRTVEEASGLGDLQTRLKINFWGNDSGPTAFGVMPFVKWPLAASRLRNGQTEGGVIFPFTVDIGNGWSLGAMTELDVVSDDQLSYDFAFVNSITAGYDLTKRLGMYAELFAVESSDSDAHWQGQLDVGWTFGLTENAQLDWGCNFGITPSAPDFSPFVGFSFRY